MQDAGTDEVLALAKMDGEALACTAENGSLWLYDPETKKAYNAAEDGAAFSVTEITAGKNGTVLLVKALPGRKGLGVFTQPVWQSGSVLAEIYRLICYKRQHGGDNSAARHLVMSGQDKILKQLGADTSSTIIASKNDSRTEVLDEMSGLWYDCLVLLAYHNINPAELLATLGDKRAK